MTLPTMVAELTLSLISVCVVVLVNLRSSGSARGIEIDHLFTFSFGFFYYWILPIIIGSLHLFAGNSLLNMWYSIYDGVPAEAVVVFQLFSLVVFLSYVWGSHVAARRYRNRTHQYHTLAMNKRVIALPCALWTCVALAYLVLLRGRLFGGYSGLSPSDPAFLLVGSLTAASLGVLGTAFVYSVKSHEDNPETSFMEAIKNPYFYIYWAIAVLISSLGGRLYFVSSLVMLATYRSVYFKRIPLRSIVGFAVIGGIVVGLIGILRTGGSISSDGVVGNVLAEPLFTSISLLSALNQHIDTAFRLPEMVASGFVNLIPSAVFPGKTDYIVTPQHFGYIINSPFGATHNYVSMMLNFGSIGTCAMLFLLGYGMAALKALDRNLVYRVTYIMLTACLAFTFFRDSFEISVVKSMLQMSVVMPILTVVLVQWISSRMSRRRSVLRELPAESGTTQTTHRARKIELQTQYYQAHKDAIT